jgi:hypothetical protein
MDFTSCSERSSHAPVPKERHRASQLLRDLCEWALGFFTTLPVPTNETVIPSLVLHGCEARSRPLTWLGGGGGSERRALKKIFGPKRDEKKTGGWRKPHNYKSTTLWDITPCSSVKVNRRFGGTYHLHVHGWRIGRARKKRASSCKKSQAEHNEKLHSLRPLPKIIRMRKSRR